MKVCKIVDESRENQVIAYLFYYEKSAAYTIELSEDLREEEAPVFFAAFISRGVRTIDQEFSLRWVDGRIIPRDRQNLGHILRDNGLKEYDEFKLLMLAEGRCSQDDLAVFQVGEDRLPSWVRDRMEHKLEFIKPLRPWELIVIYNEGSIWRIDVSDILQESERTRNICTRPDKHSGARLMPGGSGVMWAPGVFLTAEELYGKGDLVPLKKDELDSLIRAYVLDSSDVSYELGCSRQYVSKLVKERSLEEFKATSSSRLFTRAELDRIRD